MKQKSKRYKNVTVESSNFGETDKNSIQKMKEGNSSSCGSSPNKYKIPSSMIVLTRQEEAELRDVIMQMTLRDCGL